MTLEEIILGIRENAAQPERCFFPLAPNKAGAAMFYRRPLLSGTFSLTDLINVGSILRVSTLSSSGMAVGFVFQYPKSAKVKVIPPALILGVGVEGGDEKRKIRSAYWAPNLAIVETADNRPGKVIIAMHPEPHLIQVRKERKKR